MAFGQRPLEDHLVRAQVVEQGDLARDPVALLRLAEGDRVVEREQQLGRVTERGQRAAP